MKDYYRFHMCDMNLLTWNTEGTASFSFLSINIEA